MTANKKLSHKLISVFLCVALLISCIPLAVSAATGDSNSVTVSDPSTIDQWKQYFPVTGDITTENAGGVWTDKSVFDADTTIDGTEFTKENENNFLVALSAIGSNMSVTGQAAAPTDTVLVLDMSNSMSGNVDDLASATNIAMQELFEANANNRVAIVTYSANSTTATKVFLPLDKYTATGNFLTSSGNTLRVANGVTNSSGTAVSGSVNLNRGTYIQGGISEAIKVLNARTETTDRIPVVVLMTDGEPTIASTNFASPDGNLAFSSNAGTSYAFATQLTLAYMKQVAFKDQGLLFYTIGVGLNNDGTAVNILNPSSSMNTSSYWNIYKSATVGSRVAIGGYTFTKTEELDYDYVSKIDDNGTNGYFSASSNNLASELSAAFEAVVAEIVKSSVYSPTLVDSVGHDLSGYVSFVDKIGSYMKVYDIKGITHGTELFLGNRISEAFYEAYQGSTTGAFGNMTDPTSLGYAFMDSVETRLGIDNAEAWNVLRNAWQKGQMSYNSATGEYSNWFGWISTTAGAYISPWYEGMELPANAGYINRSYIYLGGLDDTNMMYSTVRIREKVLNGVATGEQEVNFALPASLLPTVTYDVELDENGELKNINVIPDTPIHLIYEVGLDSEINKFNVKDKVSAEYLAANTDSNGNVLFYTNEWEREPDADGNITGYYKSNTYSYFRPSQKNDRYYYQNDSLVYSDSNAAAVYVGESSPALDTANSYYYHYNYYSREGNSYKTVSQYHVVPNDVLSVAHKNDDNTWTIKAGTVRSDYSGSTANVISKLSNPTGTLSFSHEPFADTNSYAWDDTTHSSVVGTTLANNGRFALTPETGIRLSKILASDVVLGDGEEPVFTFEISYSNITDNLEAYAYRYDALSGELMGGIESVNFTGGKATVKLLAGETLYIGGMQSGEVTVTEQTMTDFVTQSILVSGTAQSGNGATVTLADGDMTDVDFVNSRRGTGSFTVAKEISHDFGVDYQVPNNQNTTFAVELSLSFNGEPLAGTYSYTHTNGQNGTQTLEGDDGEVWTVYLNHQDQFTINGLPEGAVVKAAEKLSTAQQASFTPSYWENIDEVTIEANAVAQVLIVNDYTATSISPNINISGTKTLTGDDYSGTFNFYLAKYVGGATLWQKIEGSDRSVTFSDDNSNGNEAKAFDFGTVLNSEVFTEAGTHIYRVFEVKEGAEGVIYDSRIHTFQINVTDNDMDGSLEYSVTTTRAPQVAVAETQSGYNVTSAFENDFANDHVVSVEIDVQKQINNPSGAAVGNNLAGFSFGLYDANGSLIEELATNSAGEVEFDMSYTSADIDQNYTYIIKEIAPNPIPTGWDYTDKEVTVTVAVSKIENDPNNHIQAIISTNDNSAVINDAKNAATLTFTNSYNPKPAVLNIDFVSKQLASNVGTRELKNGEFSFEIREFGTNTVVATGTNNEFGEVSFTPTITYDKVGGPYFYDIVEVKPANAPDYIEYDSTVYKMSVTVTDNGGILIATPVVDSVAENQVIFSNVYIADSAELTLSGSKTLSGRLLTENDFQFVLTEQTANGDGEVWYASNESYGTNESVFTFPTISYTSEGVYTYTVTEFNPETNDGVVYDDTSYTVVVTVEDNTDGKLVATYTVDGSSEKAISFENVYDPENTTATIWGLKNLEGRALKENEFTFNLYEAGTDWAKGELVESVSNTPNGKFSFTELSFNDIGTYAYIVTEAEGSLSGITYDSNEWHIIIRVSDDNNGKMSADIYYVLDDNVKDAMVFTNIYEVSGDIDVTLKGKKTLNGRELKDNEFTFELYEANEEFEVSDEATMAAKNVKGEFKFEMNYTNDQIGNTYYYVVKELNGGKTVDGVKYDDTEYKITVSVEDDLDGGVKAVVTKMKGENSVDSLDFTNEYEEVVNPPQPPQPPTPPVVDDTPESPKTGQKINLTELFALLIIGGGWFAVATRKLRKAK